MPDLNESSVHSFWDTYDRRTLYRVIVALMGVEHWTVDSDADIEPAVLELGRSIDLAADIEITDEAKIIRILANTSAGRAMRILQSVDGIRPGSASQILMKAEELSADKNGKLGDKYAKLFLQRNLVFERLQLLSRVFAPQRISLVLKALEKFNEE